MNEIFITVFLIVYGTLAVGILGSACREYLRQRKKSEEGS
jgi:hypothetical protein